MFIIFIKFIFHISYVIFIHNLLIYSFLIYADLECLLTKEPSRQNNLENSYTQRKAKLKPPGYSLSLICSFDEIKNRCKEKFCYDKNKISEYALYHNVRDHWPYTRKFRGAAHNIYNLQCNVLKKILIVFGNV